MLKKLAVACAALGACFAVSAAPAFAGVEDFLGQWSNTNAATSGLTRIAITQSGRGGPLQVEVYGRCHPSDCDWGVVDANAYATAGAHDPDLLTAEFNTGGAHRLVIMRLTGGGMSYEVLNDFSGRGGGYYEDGAMNRLAWRPGGWPPGGGGGWPPGGGGGGGWPPGGGSGGGGLGSEDCVSFNTANLQVVNNHGAYTLNDGGHAVIAFPNVGDALRALAVIRNYGLSAQCFVSRPNAAMTYWLAGRRVPNQDMSYQDCNPVNPGNVQSQNVHGSWKVVDGSNWLLDYGANRASADQAVAVIQHYNLNRQCFVGRPNAPMQYWLAR